MRSFYLTVAKSFYPRPLDASAVLIRAKVDGEEKLPGYDFTNGWGGLFAGGIETLPATGDHLTMVHDEQHLMPLGRQIDELLDQSQRIFRETTERGLPCGGAEHK